MSGTIPKRPSLGISLLPLCILVGLLGVNIYLFGDNAAGGANQMVLIMSGVFTVALGVFWQQVPYKHFEKQIVESIGYAMVGVLILLTVGALISMWTASGIVPGIIFYGLQLLSPSVFLPACCVICAVVALATGSSWSTSGTVGVALMGIGMAMGIPVGMVAGAVISGGYFGDKLSPMSDTTNLAPAVSGAELFSHIRHMLVTVVPSFVLALVVFLFLGWNLDVQALGGGQVTEVTSAIDRTFELDWRIFVVPLVVFALVLQKMPALPALVMATLMGGLAVPALQPDLLIEKLGPSYGFVDIYKFLLEISFGGFKSETGHKMIDALFSRGGMANMLPTVWLVFAAMVFGGAMEAAGFLQRIAEGILSSVRKAGTLVGATIASCLFVNLSASDQYLSIIVPGRMFRAAYHRHGLEPKNLSRALEDGGTVTSVLIPWNTCGAYHAMVLGVPTLVYAPYCIFNIASPMISAFVAGMELSLTRMPARNMPAEA